jgi:hypothetical protein
MKLIIFQIKLLKNGTVTITTIRKNCTLPNKKNLGASKEPLRK